jgi:hypothetical protein
MRCTDPLCLPKSLSSRNALSHNAFSGYGRTCVESSVGSRDDQVAVPDAEGARAREPGASAAARGAHPHPQWPTPTPRGVGPGFLGDRVAGVGRLEERPRHRGARDRDPLASRRLQALVETEEQFQTPCRPVLDRELSLAGDAPEPRSVQGPELGEVVEFPRWEGSTIDTSVLQRDGRGSVQEPHVLFRNATSPISLVAARRLQNLLLRREL